MSTANWVNLLNYLRQNLQGSKQLSSLRPTAQIGSNFLWSFWVLQGPWEHSRKELCDLLVMPAKGMGLTGGMVHIYLFINLFERTGWLQKKAGFLFGLLLLIAAIFARLNFICLRSKITSGPFYLDLNPMSHCLHQL